VVAYGIFAGQDCYHKDPVTEEVKDPVR
jgi:hypothetical protein